jgi:uncharacterized protein (TIGR04255 family)
MIVPPLPNPIFKPEHYPRAPIREALIDLQVTPSEKVTLCLLEQVKQEVQSEFPVFKKRGVFEAKYSAGANVGASAQQKETGFAFFSGDGLHVLQARVDGFTFSRLAPYDCWESLRDQARRYWAIYRRCIGELGINRIAVRYINQVDIPNAPVDLDDYFLTAPRIGAQLPQAFDRFQLQVEASQPDLGSNAIVIVTQALVKSSSVDTVSVIVDIDAFVQGISAADDEAWPTLEALRVRKNDYFEGSITDRTRELFR